VWQRSIAMLAEEGLPMTEFPVRSTPRMVSATKNLFDGVTLERFTHDGNARLASHVANAVIKEDSSGVRLTKPHSSSKEHIDLAMAAAMAYDTLVSTPPPQESVYEKRGVVFI
jgi:phage terminase large subunit-like protein